MSRDEILVYGTGKFYEEYINILESEYSVVARFDKTKRTDINDNDVLPPEKIKEYPNLSVVIMVDALPACFSIIEYLNKDLDVPAERIRFGSALIREWSDRTGVRILEYNKNGALKIDINGFVFETDSIDEINNVKEVLVEEIYDYSLNNGKEDVIIDVGMNIGDSVYYFAKNKPSVVAVYGYEPFNKTYMKAVENTGKLKDTNVRIKLNQTGWSDRGEEVVLSYNPNMSCGMSTIENVNSSTSEKYREWGLLDEDETVQETIVTIKASEELNRIINENQLCNIVLKMDCEGSEYGIIEDLVYSNVLSKIDLLMLEWHYKGNGSIKKALNESGFSYICMNKSSDMGLIYAFNNRLKK